MGSIVVNWKKFGTTRFAYPAKVSNRSRKVLVREVTKNRTDTLNRAS